MDDSQSFVSGVSGTSGLSAPQSLSGSLSSSKSSSSSLKSKVRSFESGFFGVLLCLQQHGQAKDKVEKTRVLTSISIGVDFLNLIAFNLKATNWGNASSYLQSVLSYTSLSVASFLTSYSAYLVIFWLVGSVIALSLVATFFVSAAFRKNEFKYMLPLIHSLRYYSTILMMVFVPFLNTLLVAENCRYLDTSVPYLVAFPSTPCWSPVAGAHAAIGAIFIASFIIFTSAFTSVYFDPSPVSRELLARPHSKLEMVLLTSRVVLAISGAIFSSKTTLLAIINFFCSSAVLFSCIYFSCYFEKRLNFIRSGLASSVWWSSCVLLAVISSSSTDNRDKFSIILAAGIIPFFCLGFLLSWLRMYLLDGSRLFARQIRDAPLPSPPSSASASSTPDFIIQPIHLECTFRNDYEYEIATRFVLDKDRVTDPRALAVACGIFEAGLKQFPNSMFLMMSYASFFQYIVKDTARATVLVQKAGMSKPPFFVRYMIYARQKQAESARNGDLDLVQIVAFQKSYRSARENHSRCVKSIRYLWKSLLPAKVDVQVLPRVMERIYLSQKKAETSFTELLRKFKNSPRVLRSYASFLEDVCLEHAVASRYFEAAEEAEEAEASRKAASGEGGTIGSYDPVSDALEERGNSGISISSNGSSVIGFPISTSPSMLCLHLDDDKIIRKATGGDEVLPLLVAAAARSSNSNAGQQPQHPALARSSSSFSLNSILGRPFEPFLASTDRKSWHDLIVSAGKDPESAHTCFISLRSLNQSSSVGAWASLTCNAQDRSWTLYLAVASVKVYGTMILFSDDTIANCDPQVAEVLGTAEEKLWDQAITAFIPGFSASHLARSRLPRASASGASSASPSPSPSSAVADSIADLDESASVSLIAHFKPTSSGSLLPAHIAVQKVRILAQTSSPEPSTLDALLLHVSFLQPPTSTRITRISSISFADPIVQQQQQVVSSSPLPLPRRSSSSAVVILMNSIANIAPGMNGKLGSDGRHASIGASSSGGGNRSIRGRSGKKSKSMGDDEFNQKVTLAQHLHRMMLLVLLALLILSVTAFSVSRKISTDLADSMAETGDAAILAGMSQRIPTRCRGQQINAIVGSPTAYQDDVDTIRTLSDEFQSLVFKLYRSGKQFTNSALYDIYFDPRIPVMATTDILGNTTLDHRSLWEISRLLPAYARHVADVPFSTATNDLHSLDAFVFLMSNSIPIFEGFNDFINAWTDNSVDLMSQSRSSESILLSICLALSFLVAMFIIQRALNKSHHQRIKCFEHLISIPKDIIGRMLTVQYHIIEEERAEEAAEAAENNVNASGGSTKQVLPAVANGGDDDDCNSQQAEDGERKAEEIVAAARKSGRRRSSAAFHGRRASSFAGGSPNRRASSRMDEEDRYMLDLDAYQVIQQQKQRDLDEAEDEVILEMENEFPVENNDDEDEEVQDNDGELAKHPAKHHRYHRSSISSASIQRRKKASQASVSSVPSPAHSNRPSPVLQPALRRKRSLHRSGSQKVRLALAFSAKKANGSSRSSNSNSNNSQRSSAADSLTPPPASSSISLLPAKPIPRLTAESLRAAAFLSLDDGFPQAAVAVDLLLPSADPLPRIFIERPSITHPPSAAPVSSSKNLNSKQSSSQAVPVARASSNQKTTRKTSKDHGGAVVESRKSSQATRYSNQYRRPSSVSLSSPSSTSSPGFVGILRRVHSYAKQAMAKALGEDDESGDEQVDDGNGGMIKKRLLHPFRIDKKMASVLKTSRMRNLILFGWILILSFCALLAVTLALRFYMLDQVESFTYQESASGKLYMRVAHARYLARELVLNPTSTTLRTQIQANILQMRAIRVGLVYGDAALNLKGHADTDIPAISEVLYQQGCKLADQASCPLTTDPQYSLLTSGLDLTLNEFLKRNRYMLNAPVLTPSDPSYLFVFSAFFHVSDPIYNMLVIFAEHGKSLIDQFLLIQLFLFMGSLTIIGLLYFSFTKRMIVVTTEERCQLQSLLLMIPATEASKLPWLEEFLSIE